MRGWGRGRGGGVGLRPRWSGRRLREAGALISLRCVSKRYGGVSAVEQVSLDVKASSTLCIVGPSGSGKTTLLRLIAGLEEPDAGEVWLDDQPASTEGWVLAPHKRSIGYVFQEPALWPHLTVAEHVRFGLRGPGSGSRVREVLRQTALEPLAHRYPGQLSGGEQRRAALARALAPKPRRLLMDEPLTNLDPALKAELLELIVATRAEIDATLVYVTHDALEPETLGGRVASLRGGRLEVG